MNAPSSPTAKVISLGCRLNISESERMKQMLAGESNVVVVNSCAVTSEAVRQTRQAIRRARKDNPEARLIVTGCAADIEREQLSKMPEVDGLIANEQKLDPRAWNIPIDTPLIEPTRTRAFVAVQNGCDHSCTFCVIPQGRGKSRSLTIEQVLSEVGHHLDQGAKEVVLTGVDVTSWGYDLEGQPKLGQLVSNVMDRFSNLTRLRMSSLDGIEIDQELFEHFAQNERMMPHLHLSLQHGHDLILKRMKRRHLRSDAVDLVLRLKVQRPDLAVGADLIAGFPTESEDHHVANLSIIDELQIVHGHIFPYSPRPGTPAARMPQLERSIVKERAAELRARVSRVRETWMQSLVGKNLRVLAERDGSGYAENFARVALPNQTIPGEIVSITPQQLEGDLLR